MAALVPRRARKAVLVPANANATENRSALDGARRRKVLSAARGAARGRLRGGRVALVGSRAVRGLSPSVAPGAALRVLARPGGGGDVTVVAVTLLAPAVCPLGAGQRTHRKKKKIEQDAFCKGSVAGRIRVLLKDFANFRFHFRPISFLKFSETFFLPFFRLFCALAPA